MTSSCRSAEAAAGRRRAAGCAGPGAVRQGGNGREARHPGNSRAAGGLGSAHARQRFQADLDRFSGAAQLLDDWRAFYNARRPHSSLSYRTPDEFAEQARGRPAARLCGDNTANVAVSPSPGRAGKADVVPLT
ncbi:integrase core domain-containing protein [Deinococcus humi]|uniref:integrase core domain-containing protein n=1 Tax=Deinococcus humi TaxID=662880 RepID=UPI003CC81E05